MKDRSDGHAGRALTRQVQPSPTAERKPDDANVRAFWSWFAGISAALGADFEDAGLLSELDTQVSRLGPYGWELGPGEDGRSVLAISPDGVRERLSETRRIVAMAPAIERWVLLAARPSRPEALAFELGDNLATLGSVSAHQWRYVLVERTASGFVLEVEAPTVSVEDRYVAVVIVLDALLGETLRLESIARVEVVAELATHDGRQSRPLESLPQHLAALLKEVDSR